MTSIADAYVELHVSGDKIASETKRELKDASPAIEAEAGKTGDKAGQELGNSFFKGFRKTSGARIGREAAKAAHALRDGMSVTLARDIPKIKTKSLFSRLIDGVEAGTLLGKKFVTDAATAIKSNASKVRGEITGMFKGLGGLKIAGIAALIPLATSGLSALTGAATALVGSLAQASGAALSFVGVIGGLAQGMIVAKLAFGGFGKAVAGDEKALAKFSPTAQKTIKAVAGLGDAWKSVKFAIQDAVFRGLDDDVKRLGSTTLPVLKNAFVTTGQIIHGVAKQFLLFASSEQGLQKIRIALAGNNKIFRLLGDAAIPILKGILNFLIILRPAGVRLAGIIRSVAKSFAAWSGSDKTREGVRKFMNRAFVSAGRLWKILKNLGAILRNVFGAATGPGDKLLKTFVRLTRQLRDFTELTSTKSSIKKWAEDGIRVSGKFFKGMGKGFQMISGLFSPAIFEGFLGIFESLMPVITPIVKVFQTALAPVLESIGEALAKNGPKFAALFQALSPLLVGLGAVIGEIISQTLDMLGTIAAVITPVVKVIAGVLGPLMVKFAPIIAAVILAFTSWGGVLVKMIPIVGRFLAPLVKLASWILKKVGPAIKGLGKIVGSVFGFIGRMIGTVVGGIGRVIGSVFGFIGKFIVGIMKTVGGAIGRGFTKAKTLVSNIVTGIWNLVERGFTRILEFFGKMPNRIGALASNFLSAGKSLGSKVIEGIGAGLSAAGGFISDIAGSVKSAINSALHLPVTIHGPGPLPDFTIPAFARGTKFAPGGIALVGERGPELVNLPRGSSVTTADKTAQVLTRGGDTLNVNVEVKDSNAEPRRIADMIVYRARMAQRVGRYADALG